MGTADHALRGLRPAALACALLAAEAPAAEAPEAADSAPSRSAVLYVDAPVPLIEGIDPALPPPEGTAVPAEDPGSRELARAVAEREAAIEAIEVGAGAWDGALAEELMALGALRRRQGEHGMAIDAFGRAMHVRRVNEGLHTVGQVEAVEGMIESYLALADWERADLYNNYLFHVQQKAYGPEDPRLIPVLERMGVWSLRAFHVGYGEPLALRLNTAQIMFNTALRILSAHFGRDDERFVRYLTHIAGSAYMVSQHPELFENINRNDYLSIQDMLQNALDTPVPMIPAGYSAGERALREIIDHYAAREDDVVRLAAATADLADWYLLFDRRRDARANYRAAWDMLQASGEEPEQVERLFSQATPIPTFHREPANLMRAAGLGADRGALTVDFVDLMFDVTETGAARNIRVLSRETPADAGRIGQVRRHVRDSRFRPLIVDGIPRRSTDHRFRVRYWH